MAWFEHWQERRRARAQRKARQRRVFRQLLGERTPDTIAKKLATSDLRDVLPSESDLRSLAERIAGLDARDVYILARLSEGQSARGIASELFMDVQTVKTEHDRIVRCLRGEERTEV